MQAFNFNIFGGGGGFGGDGGGNSVSGKSSAESRYLGDDDRHYAPPAPDWAATDHLLAALKRSSSQSLYHQSLFGAHYTRGQPYGQTEAWFSANSLVKRPRSDSLSHLPTYPQRPGHKDCSYYMLTRTCKFGVNCKFDHPIWVPEGGIPDWQEVQLNAPEVLPQRPGEPDCPFYLKTRRCKFGDKCKFNHPKEETNPLAAVHIEYPALPERPSEPTCAFYMKTGKCKYGISCKFHHPKDVELFGALHENNSHEHGKLFNDESSGDLKPVTPALLHNTKGLPIRLGEVDCPFYLKTGSCKYGQSCRFNHPDGCAINPPAAAAAVASPAPHFGTAFGGPATSIYQNFSPRLTQTTGFNSTEEAHSYLLQLVLGAAVYPQRPGESECNFYLKTGECKFGQSCRFHHPLDRRAGAAVSGKEVVDLPRREDAIYCPYYMKTGVCKYGVACKFDHPPHREVVMPMTTAKDDVKN